AADSGRLIICTSSELAIAIGSTASEIEGELSRTTGGSIAARSGNERTSRLAAVASRPATPNQRSHGRLGRAGFADVTAFRTFDHCPGEADGGSTAFQNSQFRGPSDSWVSNSSRAS